ncbi:MAG: spore maturation protein, partial [Bdellovibrionales bacterium]|nr:spore maturation protein [Bdellovibrionales bacterium]
VLFGVLKRVSIYETMVEGAKEGFQLAITIIPFLVVVLVAVGISKASGLFALFSGFIQPFSSPIGIPAEAVPMALIRPLSGTGAFALMSELIIKSPDSYPAFVASVMMGSTETTFYVLSVYFGSVGVTKFRYAVIAGVLADLAGMFSAGIVSSLWY